MLDYTMLKGQIYFHVMFMNSVSATLYWFSYIKRPLSTGKPASLTLDGTFFKECCGYYDINQFFFNQYSPLSQASHNAISINVRVWMNLTFRTVPIVDMEGYVPVQQSINPRCILFIRECVSHVLLFKDKHVAQY